jgi:FixJ family two-component response regulator
MYMVNAVARHSASTLLCAKPTVWFVDTDASVSESLQGLIDDAGWQSRRFTSASEFLSQPDTVAPSCLVLDVHLPDTSGLELQARMIDRPATPIIFIASQSDIPMTVRAMRGGAIEFFAKPLQCEAMFNAIRYAISLSAKLLERERIVRALRDRYSSLSLREREVLELVIKGYLNKQVSGELGISEITVKAHRGKMMRKMAAKSLPHLVTMAAGLQLISSLRYQ